MTIDRNALASDLESLGLKAVASGYRRDTLSTTRVLRGVERLRDVRQRAGRTAGATAAQEVLDRYRGEES